jgi:ABC-type iron transport system FetAB permease component
MRQAWISLAVWIAFGILLEGFSAFRSAVLLDDYIRRDMFRLAHSHGTLLNLLLVSAAICARLDLIRLRRSSSISLRTSVVLLPLGFFLAGVWHFKDEPGLAILLVPVGAVLLLVAAIQISLTLPKHR